MTKLELKYRVFLFGEAVAYILFRLAAGLWLYLSFLAAFMNPDGKGNPGCLLILLGFLFAVPLAWPVSLLFDIELAAACLVVLFFAGAVSAMIRTP